MAVSRNATRSSLRLSACVLALLAATVAAKAQEPQHSAELDAMIVKAAKRHGVPEHLVRRIVMRESRYNPRARNHSFWGLMQISYPTARSMGFRGTPQELLNPLTNLTYAVPYLANAFLAAGKREDAAVRLYASGYYATAKNHGVLGLLRTAESRPLNGVVDEPVAVAAAPESGWSLFGSPSTATPTTATPAAPAVETPAQPQLAYAATPQTTASAPAQAQIDAVAGASAAPAHSAHGGHDESDTAMVEGKDGRMAPPRKWQRDGGTTVLARGEQGAETIAAARGTGASEARRSHGRAHKTTVFAQIDPDGARAPTAEQAPPAQPVSFYATAPEAASAAANDAGAAQAPQAAPQDAAAEPTESKSRHASRRRHQVAKAAGPKRATAPAAVAQLRQ